jgi:hypothetical protein
MSFQYYVTTCPTLTTNNNTTTNITMTNISNALIDENYYVDATLTVMGKILSFSSVNFVPNSVKVIFIFVDDIWYYKFHRTSYPIQIQYFLERTDIFYEFRFNPWFVKEI